MAEAAATTPSVVSTETVSEVKEVIEEGDKVITEPEAAARSVAMEECRREAKRKNKQRPL